MLSVKQLKKVLPPSKRQNKKVFLVSYIEDADTTTITYAFKGQKESHLKISKETWQGMKFEQEDEKIIISNLNGISVSTNSSGWSRLVNIDAEEDCDE